MSQALLDIRDLCANAGDTPILKGLSLTINPGEVHAIMGPNGSGKSTLAHVLSGRDGYEITSGSILFKGQDITELAVDERSHLGIFLAFQYPVEIPGVSNLEFMKTALAAHHAARGEEAMATAEFVKKIRGYAKDLNLAADFLKRGVNEGFSGGEKKRNEIVQMRLLEPALALLDETDSGLDIDALKVVADGVNLMRSPERSFVVVTHYQRLLDYITPDYVHVLAGGEIVKSGGADLARELEAKGYGWIVDNAAA